MANDRPLKFPKMRTVLRRLLILALFIVGDPTPHSLIAGLVLIAIGQIIHFIAGGTLVKTEVLTIAGPYRFVRNPFYVSNFLTDAGFCVVAWNPWIPLVWFPLFYGWVIHPRVKVEEADLLRIHGQAYQDYLNRVPRYIPSLVPRYPHVRGAWSLGPLRKNREVPRQLRHFAFALMFFCKDRMIDAQGGDKWSVDAFPTLLKSGLAAFVFWTGIAMIVAPWIWKLVARIFRKAKKRIEPAPEPEKVAP